MLEVRFLKTQYDYLVKHSLISSNDSSYSLLSSDFFSFAFVKDFFKNSPHDLGWMHTRDYSKWIFNTFRDYELNYLNKDELLENLHSLEFFVSNLPTHSLNQINSNFNESKIFKDIHSLSYIKHDYGRLLRIFPDYSDDVSRALMWACDSEIDLTEVVSTPPDKLYYPEPFIASPSFVHEDIWFIHVLHFQHWLWFFFISIIMFYFIAFLHCVQYCSARNQPKRETRGVSRSKCADFITAVVPLVWAYAILLSESVDANDYNDGSGTGQIVIGIRAYQWGWEYFYPKSINLNYNLKPSYSSIVGNSLKYSNSSSLNLGSNSFWKAYQKKNSQNLSSSPIHLLMSPTDNSKLISGISFNNIGLSSIKESSAFKKIQYFSKINNLNSDSFTSNFSNRYNKINSMYLNTSKFNDSYSYGTFRQHNYTSLNSNLNGFESLLDNKGVNKLLNFTLNLNYNKSKNTFNKDFIKHSYLANTNVFNSLNSMSLLYIKNLSSFSSSFKDKSLFKFFSFYPTTTNLFLNVTNTKKHSNPILRGFINKNLKTVKDFSNISFFNSSFYPSDLLTLSSSFKFTNSLINDKVNLKFKNLKSQDFKFAEQEKNVRFIDYTDFTKNIFNFNNWNNNFESTIVPIFKNSVSSNFTNLYSLSNSKWLNTELIKPFLYTNLTFNTSHSAIYTNKSNHRIREFDRYYMSEHTKDEEIFPPLLNGSGESLPNYLFANYWLTYWSNTKQSNRVLHLLNKKNLSSISYIPKVTDYAEYNFKNWQTLELLEDNIWESSIPVISADEYLLSKNNFKYLNLFKKQSMRFNKRHREKTYKFGLMIKSFNETTWNYHVFNYYYTGLMHQIANQFFKYFLMTELPSNKSKEYQFPTFLFKNIFFRLHHYKTLNEYLKTNKISAKTKYIKNWNKYYQQDTINFLDNFQYSNPHWDEDYIYYFDIPKLEDDSDSGSDFHVCLKHNYSYVNSRTFMSNRKIQSIRSKAMFNKSNDTNLFKTNKNIILEKDFFVKSCHFKILNINNNNSVFKVLNSLHRNKLLFKQDFSQIDELIILESLHPTMKKYLLNNRKQDELYKKHYADDWFELLRSIKYKLSNNIFPVFNDECLPLVKNISKKNFISFITENTIDSLDEVYNNLKYSNDSIHSNNNHKILNNMNFIFPLSYAYILNNFRANCEELCWNNNFYKHNEFNTHDFNSNNNLRNINPLKLRLPAKNSIVTYNSIQKVFKTRFDEGRSNARLKDLSNSFTSHPFLTQPKSAYESMIGKNKESFYSLDLYSGFTNSNFNSFYTISNSLNTPFFDIPFLVSLKSDASRYLWFDWHTKWSSIEVQPSSAARYSLTGVPYFNKSFEYNSLKNEGLNESENYLNRLVKARKNYLHSWSNTSYLYSRIYSWYKLNAIGTNPYNSFFSFKYLLKKSNNYWLRNTIHYSSKSSLSFSTPSFSGVNTPIRSHWRPSSSIQSYYYTSSILNDILSKRELLYRTYFKNKNFVTSIPSFLISSPNNVLLNEVKNGFLLIDPINFSSEISRELLYSKTAFLKFDLLKLLLNSLNSNLSNSPLNLSYINNYLFFYLFGGFNTDYNLNKSNTLYKNQYRPMKRGISNMIRLQATGAVAMPIEIRLHVVASSRDIIHSWAIPSAGIKIDCVPGYSSHRITIFLVSGIFWGQCMEICGRFHHWMPIVVYFMKKDLFFLWCTHFMHYSALNDIFSSDDKQFTNKVRFVSFDKTTWISSVNQ